MTNAIVHSPHYGVTQPALRNPASPPTHFVSTRGTEEFRSSTEFCLGSYKCANIFQLWLAKTIRVCIFSVYLILSVIRFFGHAAPIYAFEPQVFPGRG